MEVENKKIKTDHQRFFFVHFVIIGIDNDPTTSSFSIVVQLFHNIIIIGHDF